jgi:hypothetical protein
LHVKQTAVDPVVGALQVTQPAIPNQPFEAVVVLHEIQAPVPTKYPGAHAVHTVALEQAQQFVGQAVHDGYPGKKNPLLHMTQAVLRAGTVVGAPAGASESAHVAQLAAVAAVVEHVVAPK